jgi:hypothetical protein
MARQEKRSRMRMLPPRVQLQQRDALTGSYPTNVRFSIDGRTGDYKINYDDTNTVDFISSDQYLPGIGFAENSIWLKNSQSNDLTSSIVTTGNIRSQVIEGLPFFHFTPGQELTPFRDNDQPAVDGKSSNNPFYATGSAVSDIGEGFTSPLWSKNKIEIDITPSSTHEVSVTNTTGFNTNFPMMYWNNETKLWEGIGLGKEFDDYLDTSLDGVKKTLHELPIGFATSISFTIAAGATNAGYIFGSPISNFGFPGHAKFYGSSSNQIQMSNYINEPFLLEKIVLYISSGLDLNNLGSSALTAVTSFFILNQRSGGYNAEQTIEYYSGSSIPATLQNFITSSKIPDTFNQTYVDSNRDLITYMQLSRIPYTVGTITPLKQAVNEALKRDYNYPVGDPAIMPQYSAQLEISASVINPIKYERGLLYNNNQPNTLATRTCEFFQKWNYSGRQGTFKPNGRDWLNSIQEPDTIGEATVPSMWASALGTITIEVNAEDKKINPYILLPTDNLIFGWQLPLSTFTQNVYLTTETYSGKGPSLTFHQSGTNKIIFYGSYIREGKEYNDGTNQLLSSETIHEVIE